MPSSVATDQTQTLGIIAGGGHIPLEVAAAAKAGGREVFIAAIDGAADPAIEAFPHSWVRLGQLGRLISVLRSAECRELVIIGHITRPDLTAMKLDLAALRHLPRIMSLAFGGDNSVLSSIVQFFEEEDFIIVGAHQVAPALLASPGALSRIEPTEEDREDIAIGYRLIDTLGPFDIGQCAVVAAGNVIAIEGAEGTDAMLQRCRGLVERGRRRRGSRVGVLVNRPKPGQELRVDLPVIGPDTIHNAAEAGLTGIAVAASQVMIAERAATVSAADSAGLFLVGISGDVAADQRKLGTA